MTLMIACGGIRPSRAAEQAARWQDLRGVNHAELNHDGSRVIVWLGDGGVGVWDVDQGTRVVGDLGPDFRAGRRTMSSDHRLVLLEVEQGARVFDANTALAVSPMLDIRLNGELRVPAVFSPDNNSLVIFEEKQAAIWDVRTGTRKAAIPTATDRLEDAPPSAIFTADGTHCFIMQPDWIVTRYETQTWKPSGKPMKHPPADSAYHIGFNASADGKWVATFDDPGENGPKGNLQIWDAATSKPIGRPLSQMNGFSAQFLADPPRVIVVPERGEGSVHALPSMKRLYAIEPRDEVDGPRVDVTPDGKSIFTQRHDGTLLLVDSAKGKTEGHEMRKATITSMPIAPDASACFIGRDNSDFASEGFHDNYIMRLTLPELKVAGTFRSLQALSPISLSRDGRRLLAREGSDDNERVLIFNASDLSPVGQRHDDE